MNIDLGRDDLTSGSAWRSAFAEMIAVFLFVFVGAGAVVATGQIKSKMTCSFNGKFW